MNTKYISSSVVKKISIFHEYVARVKMQIFSPPEMKNIKYLPNKVNFLFIIYSESTEIQKAQPNFSLIVVVRFDFFNVFIVYSMGWKHSLHLGNDIESYFSEWNTRNQHVNFVHWHSGRSATIRESNHGSGECKEHYAWYCVPKRSILLARNGAVKISSVACGFCPVKIDCSVISLVPFPRSTYLGSGIG